MAVLKTKKKRKKRNVAVNRKRRNASGAGGKRLHTAIALPRFELSEPLVRFGTVAAGVVLLGMGGSSLAPEVFSRTFKEAAGLDRGMSNRLKGLVV